MDPDAKIQIATMGTALYFDTDLSTSIDNYTVPVDQSGNITATRVYGLASTPDFGGEPNTIDSTTLDNTEYETYVLGLQSVSVLGYEINMMAVISENKGIHNLSLLKGLGTKVPVRWILKKASGVTFVYDAVLRIQYNADEQSAIEKFTIYHGLKSKIRVIFDDTVVRPTTVTPGT